MAIPKPERRRRRHASRHRLRRGRVWVLLIFCALRCSDALTYFAAPPAERSRILAGILVGFIWTTVVLNGLWLRKDWCRYVLSFLIVCSTIAATILVPRVYQLPADYHAIGSLLAAACINGAVIWVLISLPDIRRLTSRAYS
jgi:hypothetical protein